MRLGGRVAAFGCACLCALALAAAGCGKYGAPRRYPPDLAPAVRTAPPGSEAAESQSDRDERARSTQDGERSIHDGNQP